MTNVFSRPPCLCMKVTDYRSVLCLSSGSGVGGSWCLDYRVDPSTPVLACLRLWGHGRSGDTEVLVKLDVNEVNSILTCYGEA